jgi:hypothetical protein
LVLVLSDVTKCVLALGPKAERDKVDPDTHVPPSARVYILKRRFYAVWCVYLCTGGVTVS